MGAVQSFPGYIGVDWRTLATQTGTEPSQSAALWTDFSHDELWGRKHIYGIEHASRGKLELQLIHTERRTQCRERTERFLRDELFEPYKNGKRGTPEDPMFVYFTTDQFSRCWYPWSQPKTLYTSEAMYARHVIKVAEEYGIKPEQISMFSEKRNNMGHVQVGLDLNSPNPA
eukprot:TRINITY_DN1476_c3_g1_i1.p1 TRINITY_DN1476_c3_g1~~TRINITY_DN1476_c3_g1_i1.p1  ORF type:complete len:172 (+),score=18.67 TRINITY_DN1476_c3_g1_i1:59-574(+)